MLADAFELRVLGEGVVPPVIVLKKMIHAEPQSRREQGSNAETRSRTQRRHESGAASAVERFARPFQ